MNEIQYQQKKKKLLLSIFCTIAIMLIIGISYAFWQTTKTQEDKNVIASGCFDVELSGKNAIDLAEVYPLSNEEGLQTLPFTFTIKNICDYKISYTVNLESLSVSTLQNSSVKVSLDGNYKLYSEYKSTSKYFDDSKDARILISGVLPKEQSKSYDLRLWLDENAPTTEQNKVFESKIVINSELASEKAEESTNDFEVGDYISMTPTSTSYTIPASLTGYSSDQTINPSELNLWRVIRKNDDGTIDVVSKYASSTQVYFSGQTGYLNYVGALNTIAAQYTNEKYVQSTRHMGYSNQIETCSNLTETECPTDTGYETDINLVQVANAGESEDNLSNGYWLASRYVYMSNNSTYFSGRLLIDNFGPAEYNLLFTKNLNGDNTDQAYDLGYSIRPILTLKQDVEIISGDGKSINDPYLLN